MGLLTAVLIVVLYFRFSAHHGNKKGKQDQRNSEAAYTESDILDALDDCGKSSPYKLFPDLGEGYTALAGSRITLFADKERWAIVYEKSGFSYRGFSVDEHVFFFGNCLKDLPIAAGRYPANFTYFPVIQQEELMRIVDGNDAIRTEVDSVNVRNVKLPVSHLPADYNAAGIDLTNGQIRVESLMRLLENQHPDLFKATEAETRSCIPGDLPGIMVIDHWHQDQWISAYTGSVGTPPGQQETFKLIAKVLVSKDTSLYKPVLSPNNHWKYWPQSGQL